MQLSLLLLLGVPVEYATSTALQLQLPLLLHILQSQNLLGLTDADAVLTNVAGSVMDNNNTGRVLYSTLLHTPHHACTYLAT